VKKLLGPFIVAIALVAIALPAAASVGQSRPAPREPMAAVEPAPKPEPRTVEHDRIADMLDGVTVMELDAVEPGKPTRRLMVRPDFRAGPTALFTVRF